MDSVNFEKNKEYENEFQLWRSDLMPESDYEKYEGLIPLSE